MGRRAPALSMLLSCEQQFRGESGHSTEVKKPENQNRNCAAQINFMPGGLRGTWAASWALPPCPGGCSVHLSVPKVFPESAGRGGRRETPSRPHETQAETRRPPRHVPLERAAPRPSCSRCPLGKGQGPQPREACGESDPPRSGHPVTRRELRYTNRSRRCDLRSLELGATGPIGPRGCSQLSLRTTVQDKRCYF